MLDPDARTVLDLMKAAGRPVMTALSPLEAREAYRSSRRALGPDAPDVALVENFSAPGPGGLVPLRYYRPAGPDELAPTYRAAGPAVLSRPVAAKVPPASGLAVIFS